MRGHPHSAISKDQLQECVRAGSAFGGIDFVKTQNKQAAVRFFWYLLEAHGTNKIFDCFVAVLAQAPTVGGGVTGNTTEPSFGSIFQVALK